MNGSTSDRNSGIHAVWNTLHDGTIERLQGSVPGDLTLTVGIAYLCGKLPTTSQHLVVRLRGCARFDYAPFHGEPVINLAELAALQIEVLSARRVHGFISVCCTAGFLTLAYESVEVSLAEGTRVSQVELEAAADRYWTDWTERSKREQK